MSLTYPFLYTLDNFQTGVLRISRFLVKFHRNKNCHNSRPNNYIDRKLEPLSKHVRNIQLPQKTLKMTSSQQIYGLIFIFLFTSDLEQLKSQIQNAWYIFLNFYQSGQTWGGYLFSPLLPRCFKKLILFECSVL